MSSILATTNQPNSWSNVELAEIRITLLGITLGAFTYGLATCLFILIIQLRVTHSRSFQGEPSLHLQNIILTVYTSVMFMLVSVTIFSSNRLLWNFFPSMPQMPFNFSLLEDHGVGTLGTYPAVINNWMADAFLIWRAYVVLEAYGKKVQIPLVVFLLWLLGGEIGLSLYQLLNPWQVDVVTTLVAMSFTISINSIGGCLIVTRLLVHRTRITHLLGKSYGSSYVSLAAIILESMVAFLLFEIFFMVSFITKHPLFNLASEVIAPVHAICSFLVIYRVLRGKADADEPQTILSKPMEFA